MTTTLSLQKGFGPRTGQIPVTTSEETPQVIYRYFVESIKDGRLPIGAKIPAERELAKQFSTSRNTVRKALLTLEQDRLIERKLGSGTYVRPPVAQNGSGQVGERFAASPLDVLEARLAIEPGIADLVVARATSVDFDRIEAAIEHMRSVADQIDDQAFKEAGYLVQVEVVRASKNPLLIKFYELLVEARKDAGWDTLRQLTDTPELRREHLRIAAAQLAALRGRDASLAREIGRTLNLRMIQQVIGTSWTGSEQSFVDSRPRF